MLIDRRRYCGVEIWRKRATKPAEYFLIILINSDNVFGEHPVSQWGEWHIPLKYGGRLAKTPPRWRDCYPVSWRKTPEELKPGIRAAVAHIRASGTPMQNDESIFA